MLFVKKVFDKKENMDISLLSIASYVVIGVLAGLLAGLLGVGGGIITVPALLFVFSFHGFPKDLLMHLAIGTSLSSMVVNTFGATYFQHRKKAVEWRLVYRIFLGIFIGSIAGIFIAKTLRSDTLQTLFGFFACAVGILFVKSRTISESHRIPHYFVLTLGGALIASLANLLGIGGGFFMVPFLSYFHFTPQKAIATSSATSFLISLFGAIGCFLFAEDLIEMPGVIGYVYLPAFAIIAAVSFFTSRFGVYLAHKIPTKILCKIFAGTLVGIGLLMIFS